MGVGSSPKEYIKAVADGYAMMTVVSLRKFGTSEQLRVLLQYVAQLEREYRNEIIADDDFDGNRKKHFRLSNLQKARNIIMGFAKSRRIPLEPDARIIDRTMIAPRSTLRLSRLTIVLSFLLLLCSSCNVGTADDSISAAAPPPNPLAEKETAARQLPAAAQGRELVRLAREH